ncbi:MAG: carboxylating nicotinate-nucleotide diphosphorylase [Patescibacteria group bacterium]
MNSLYKKWVKQFTFAEMEKDSIGGDVTTETLFAAKETGCASILAKEAGIFAGRQEIEFFLNGLKNVSYEFFKKDGEKISAGDEILRVNGHIRTLLKAERIILNLFGRMSGVATKTRQIVDKIRNPHVLITPTRKTLWGMLDKRACLLGGGGTHRFNLSDAVLIKDNHLDLMARDISLALSRFKKIKRARFLEIEVENFGEAVQAAEVLQNFKLPCLIMLDNMKPVEIKRVILELKKRDHKNIKIEASGEINEKNVTFYAKAGVDVISMGCLTKNAKSLDFSMDVK